MKRTIFAASALAVIALITFTAPILAQGPTPVPFSGYGMMSGRGMMGSWNYGYAPNQTITPTVPSTDGWGGMMGGLGRGRMGNYGLAPNAKLLTMDDAVARAQQYVAAYNNSDLKLDEVEEYAWNFYGLVKEKSTGNGAFEIIVDKSNGAVYPEMGPNMMWNTKYSMMGGMMGGWFNPSSGKMTLTMDQARANAEQFVKANLPNTTVENKGDTFYGYYHLDVTQNGKTFGMLSVNGYSGAVWYHTWHGDWIASKEIE